MTSWLLSCYSELVTFSNYLDKEGKKKLCLSMSKNKKLIFEKNQFEKSTVLGGWFVKSFLILADTSYWYAKLTRNSLIIKSVTSGGRKTQK